MDRARTERRSAIREYLLCEYSPAFFCERFVWTQDQTDSENPFKRFPDWNCLRELLCRLYAGDNLLVEKSRQMMISWTVAAFLLWCLLYRDGFSAFVVSRREDEVDDGGARSTPNSIMGKIRFIHENLPAHLKLPLRFHHLRILSPERDSYVIGESANPNAGRGGSYSFALIDEAAFVPESEQVFAALSRACPRGLVLVSTPNGRGNVFARLRHTEESSFHVLRIHWRDHPEWDDAWYQKITRDMTPEQVARELDISYSASCAGRVYGEFRYDLHVGEEDYREDEELYVAWDFGIADPTAMLWIQVNPAAGLVRVIDEYQANNQPVSHYVSMLRSRPYKEAHHLGDPAGESRSAVGGSWISELAQAGIVVRHRRSRVQEGIAAVKRLLSSEAPPRFVVNSRCLRLIECFENYRYPTRSDGSMITGVETPVHDEYSHLMDALRYFVVNRYPLRERGWRQR